MSEILRIHESIDTEHDVVEFIIEKSDTTFNAKFNILYEDVDYEDLEYNIYLQKADDNKSYLLYNIMYYYESNGCDIFKNIAQKYKEHYQ